MRVTDAFDVLTQFVSLLKLRGLVGPVHGHAREVVLDHALTFANCACPASNTML